MSGESVSDASARCQVDVDEDGWFSWRLTANNGRVIALGTRTHRDDAACRAELSTLCEKAAGLTGGVQHAAESNGWIWRLRGPDGQVSAVSARAYERHSTCQAAYERFRVLLLKTGAAGAASQGGAG
ncbi:hypothetical protein [Streptomyces sp. NPDC049040]|uniref:hypothetical protein n=1 Tax=Streptomyces sp. NPDC049040 TaxID=3365593 RepID=UPI003715FE45